MSIGMRSYCEKRKKNKRITLKTYLPTFRPCLDSLPLPGPCLLYSQPRSAAINPICLQSCSEKLPVCHCANDNYCTKESCFNSDNCKKFNPYLCPHGLKDSEIINNEIVDERITPDIEFDDDNDLDDANCDGNLELEANREEKIPVRSFANRNDDTSNTDAYDLIQQGIQSPSRNESRDILYKDLTVDSFTNKDYITPNISNLPDPENDRDMHNSSINTPSKNTVALNVDRDDNRVLNDMSLTGFHRSELQHNLQQDLTESLEPTTQNSRGTSTIQFNKYKSHNIESTNESVKISNNDASNQCCLPPYIQTASATVDTSTHIENTPSLSKQEQSFRRFNSSNGNEAQNENSKQSAYKITSNLELNENSDVSKDKINDVIESTHQNKRHQSLQVSQNESISKEFARNNNATLSRPSMKAITKAGCCKSRNSGKMQDTFYGNEFNNKHFPTNRPNQSKFIHSHGNQLSDPNYDSNSDIYDSSHRLSNRQRPDCCGRGIRGVNPNFTNSKQEHIRNKVAQKSIDIDCACSQYKIVDGKHTQCKKNIACDLEFNSSACASMSCVMNQIPGCQCRYPPSFKQFNCVGNITGNCNCTAKK